MNNHIILLLLLLQDRKLLSFRLKKQICLRDFFQCICQKAQYKKSNNHTIGKTKKAGETGTWRKLKKAERQQQQPSASLQKYQRTCNSSFAVGWKLFLPHFKHHLVARNQFWETYQYSIQVWYYIKILGV